MIMKNSFLKDSVIAHRGIYDNKKTIENTLEAFKKAMNKGYSIELDLHLTKDKKIVVFHDDTLDRLTDKRGRVDSFTLEELKNTKLLDTETYIPSFDDVLNLVDGKVPLLVELKSSVKGCKLEREVSKRLKEYNGEYAIQSFNPKSILWFRIFNKNVTRGLLISPKTYKLYNYSKLMNTCKPDFINVNKILVDEKLVKGFNGIKLAYVIDKSEKYKYSDKCDNMICNI